MENKKITNISKNQYPGSLLIIVYLATKSIE